MNNNINVNFVQVINGCIKNDADYLINLSKPISIANRFKVSR